MAPEEEMGEEEEDGRVALPPVAPPAAAPAAGIRRV